MTSFRVPLPQASSKECDDVHRAFGAFRNYVIHEDALINERLQRLLIIQGFLFAAEASLLPKFAECTPDKTQFWALALFAFLVPIIGGASAHCVHPALMAAREAIDELGVRWKGDWKARADLYHLPELLGGGAKDADKNGHKHILNIVYCFMAVWLGVFYITCAFIVQSLTHTQLSGETLLQIQSVLVSFRWPKRELLLVVLIGGAFWICFIRRSLPKPTSKSKS